MLVKALNIKRSSLMYRLTIISGGSGNPDYILPIAVKKALEADYLIASSRFSKIINHSAIFPFKSTSATLELIKNLLEKGNVAVIVSGDALMYSFLNTIKRELPDIKAEVIAGVGSLQLLGAKFGQTMENAGILSVHGRDVSENTVIDTVRTHKTVFFLCSAENSPSYLCKIFLKYGLENLFIGVGSNLTYENEITESGFPSEISKRSYPPLTVMLAVNPDYKPCYRNGIICDSDFFRNSSPMTKEEVRAVVLLKLKLNRNSVFWDLGAGTGSISVEASGICRKVFAVEKNQTAISAIEENKRRFKCENLEIIQGDIAEKIHSLPVPDVVFIGGSNGTFIDIMEFLMTIEKPVRIVMTAVTLETQSLAFPIMKKLFNFEAVQLNISHLKPVGKYSVLSGENSVMIFSGYTKTPAEN